MASAHVAVLTVAPWEDYAEALQPVFKITPEEALAQALPTTSAIEEKILDATLFRAKVALPTTTFTETTTSSVSTLQAPQSQTDSTSTTSSGDISAITYPESPVGARSAASLPGASVLTTALGTNSFLKYWAATALYEEVQLINRHLRDAAIDANYTPYVVRLQVSLLPRTRGAPYDADAMISAFFGDWGEEGGTFNMNAQAPSECGKTPGKCGKTPNECGVRLLPLLVTDDLERTIRSRSVDEIRDMAFAIAAMLQGVGLGADFRQVDEQLRTVLARDINSAFTIARVSDNTIRCRFGAVVGGDGELTMVPQTHNVSLLVLVPKACEKNGANTVRFACRTDLVDVKTGQTLVGQSRAQRYESVRRVLLQHGFNNAFDVPDPDIAELVSASTSNEFERFQIGLQVIRTKDPKDGEVRVQYAEAIWVDVVSVRNASQFSSATLSLPKERTPSICITGQTPLLIDDGRAALTTVIRGGLGLRASELQATLTVGQRVLVATGVRVIEDGREVILVFPSIASLKIPEPECKAATLDLACLRRQNHTSLEKFSRCEYLLKPEPAKTGFSATAGATQVVCQAGQGAMQITFAADGTPPDMQFSVQGADVLAVLPACSASRVGARWKVASPATITLRLGNLATNNPVRIRATDATAKVDLPEIVLPVFERSSTPTTQPN